ncbi:MAG: hypothetical protein JJE22_17580 [Bacteroidia bacterium]|nr:hypothetical protein [Bacteroidia bacterium]
MLPAIVLLSSFLAACPAYAGSHTSAAVTLFSNNAMICLITARLMPHDLRLTISYSPFTIHYSLYDQP